MADRWRGSFMQMAYLVDDIDEAVERWAGCYGVGPFFMARHVKFRSLTYRGSESPLDVSLAFAFSGELQIELIAQHNDAPSVYLDFRKRSGQGLQHLGALTRDLAGDSKQLLGQGFTAVQRSISSSGSEVIYFERSSADEMIELIQSSPALLSRFDKMKQASRQWDGKAAVAVEVDPSSRSDKK